MSFVRVSRRTQSASGMGRKPKRKHKKRPTWDDTTTDLSVYKLSRDEVEQRHKVHLSSNLDAVKVERRKQALANAQKDRSLNASSQAGLLREILYDEKQLSEAIAHSDRVMSVVQDLFGDDPKRLTGMPHVTLAPGSARERRRQTPIVEVGAHTSHLDVLSDSVMDPQALNDVHGNQYDTEGDDDNEDDEEDKENTPVFDSRLDLNKFQNVVSKQLRQVNNDEQTGSTVHKKLLQHSNQGTHSDPVVTPNGKTRTQDMEGSAINDTAKVKKKLRSRTKINRQGSEQDSVRKTRHEDLIRVTKQLQDQIDLFETSRGHDRTSSTFNLGSQGIPTLSGYTVFLVQTIAKLVGYLNESEARWQREREERNHLEAEMMQQRRLIDAITVDMIKSQELHLKIQSEARLQVNQLEQRLQFVERIVDNKEILESWPDPPSPKQDIPVRQPPTSQKPSLPDSMPALKGNHTLPEHLPRHVKNTLETGPQEANSAIPLQNAALSGPGLQPNSRTSAASLQSQPAVNKEPPVSIHAMDRPMWLPTNLKATDKSGIILDRPNADTIASNSTSRSYVPNNSKFFQPSRAEGLIPRVPVVTSTSSSGLFPFQPAMLLSPPRQKDRRSFIRPPGYGLTTMSSSNRQHFTAGIIGQVNSRDGISSAASAGRLVSLLGNPPVENNETQVPVTDGDNQSNYGYRHTNVNHSTDKSNIARGNLLVNNFVDGLNGSKHNAPSILSVDSTSTRYLSLPGERGETPYVSSAQNGISANHPVLPRAQQNLAGPSIPDYGSFAGATVTALENVAAASSLELSEKIASLSRQHAEARARLDQLKGAHGIDGLDDQQRAAASGSVATTRQMQMEQTSHRNTGVLQGASPPISPIGRDPVPHKPTTSGSSHVPSEGRTVHVSLSRLDELEISATSTPASKRASVGSGGPSPAVSHVDWKTPNKNTSGEDQFFALKAHLSS